MKKTLIQSARIWHQSEHKFKTVDIVIEKKQISAILPANSKQQADNIINADNKLVLPGLIDSNVHLREPGQTHKATISSETRAAAANGITTLIATPNTSPVIDDPSVVQLIQQKSRHSKAANILLTAALSKNLQGQHLSKMASLKEAGCIAFNQMDYPMADNQTLRNALEYASSLDMKVIVQPLDRTLAHNGCIHEGRVATRLGLKGIPDIAETTALLKWLTIAEYTQTHIHFSQISCKESVDLIRRAKDAGQAVSCDVGINHLLLTEMDCANFNSQTHILPPLRTQRDQEMLIQAVNDDTIDIICSQHQPHDSDAKLAPFADSEPGISGLDLFLPLLLRLVEAEKISIEKLIQKASTNPAKLAQIEAGEITEGKLADLIIVDEAHEFEVDPEQFLSQGKNTPYIGWALRGKVEKTLINGK